MKKLLITLFCFTSIILNATIYYCSPTGNDSRTLVQAQSISTPWKSWHHAFNYVTPGDTVYFRGGIYAPYNTLIGATINTTAVDGTYSHPTCFFAYPADWATGSYPVMECQTLVDSWQNWGVEISRASHLRFKGLFVRNVRQVIPYVAARAMGWYLWSENSTTLYRANDIRFENCVAHNIGGNGFKIQVADSVYFKNCDAFVCCDSISEAVNDPGGNGVGFAIGARLATQSNADYAYANLQGCRGWLCSDEGFTFDSKGTVIADSCWSIASGNMPFTANAWNKGSGFKLWYNDSNKKNTIGALQLTMTHCIAAYNAHSGINFTNDDGEPYVEIRCHLYNNFVYRSIYDCGSWGDAWGYGVRDGANVDTVGAYDHILKNNLSYLNLEGGEVGYRDKITGIRSHSSNNLFDVVGTPVTNAYFLSLDTTGMMGIHERKADWSLPDTDFGKPASSSPLINTGVYVGLDTVGAGADIGWAEYGTPTAGDEVVPSVVLTTGVYASTTYALVNANVYDDGGGTVSERGICYAETANPTIAGDHTSNGTGIGEFSATITGLTASTTYHVRAFATNEIGTSYGDDIEFTTKTTSTRRIVVFGAD